MEKAMSVKLNPPSANDWGMLVRFAQNNSCRLSAATLARLLEYGCVEYVERKPKVVDSAEVVIARNKERLGRARAMLSAIDVKKPDASQLRELLYKLEQIHVPIPPCRDLKVSAKGWTELKKWGIEKSNGMCAA